MQNISGHELFCILGQYNNNTDVIRQRYTEEHNTTM